MRTRSAIRKSVYFGISKLTMYFLCSFDVPCTILSTVYFDTVLFMSLFLLYRLHWKASAVN